MDAENRLDFDGMLAALKEIPEGDVVLLHACCHNPTGFDLSREQWGQVLEVVKQRNLLPLVDFAYQASAKVSTRMPMARACWPRTSMR